MNFAKITELSRKFNLNYVTIMNISREFSTHYVIIMNYLVEMMKLQCKIIPVAVSWQTGTD